jgi:NAD(P)-dependent dehydrogenase (short-subunit alcohol dehydrogenase family)
MADIDTIIITGGAGHLGTAVARCWAKLGAHIVLIDRDTQRLEKAHADLDSTAATIIAIPADASQDGALSAEVAKLSPLLWSTPPSLIVAHALHGKDDKGNAPRIGALGHGPFREVIDANLNSAVFAIDAILPFMRQAGGGRIVLVSSTAGLSASPTAALSYSLSKAGLAALPRLLAPELATLNVLINSVAPGKFDNPDWPDDPEQVQRYKQGVPLGRLASAEEVAALIVFLASAANGYITGQTIVQDGGRLARAG